MSANLKFSLVIRFTARRLFERRCQCWRVIACGHDWPFMVWRNFCNYRKDQLLWDVSRHLGLSAILVAVINIQSCDWALIFLQRGGQLIGTFQVVHRSPNVFTNFRILEKASSYRAPISYVLDQRCGVMVLGLFCEKRPSHSLSIKSKLSDHAAVSRWNFFNLLYNRKIFLALVAIRALLTW